MRKRIWRMSEDKFDNRKTKLLFPSETLEIVGQEGTKIQGEFSFSSGDDIPLRGIVYSSNPYVRVLKPQFQGTDITIRFDVLGQHYAEGDYLRGYFTIVYNGGEHRLPFDVQFQGERLLCSTGEITSLTQFAEFAKGHWNEAMQLFYSKSFAGFMERQDIQYRLLYTGYRRALPSSANLEEFLVAAGLKEAVSFSVNEREVNFYGVTENRKETLLISKSAWGHVEITVESDNDFVTVEKDFITSDYFLGSTMLLNYYIHKNHMHAGKNFARITFSCKGIIHEVQVMATFDREDATREWNHRQMKREMMLLTQVYEDYRFHRITTGDWCEQSIGLLEDMLRMDSDNCWYQLMKAQCYIVNKQRQEALWIIQDMKRDILDKTGVEWAYLLYLCTLIEQEENYVNRLTKEIEVIFRKHPEDPRIFWLLSFLREEYINDNARKLGAVEQWIAAGNASPFFYIEAYDLMLQDPYLVHEFSRVNLQILYWAARRGVLNRDLALQVSHILERQTEFSEKIWFVVEKSYELFPDEEFFAHIVAYLLRNELYQERFLPWYRNGIEGELRLNGLYEAYMMTLPENSTEALPPMLVHYFRYSCNLPYQKKALLYANVILNRREIPHLYEQYLRAIELFAIEQMKANRINDNLAIVYQNVLEMGVVDADMAHAAAGMIFMKKLVCIFPDITRVFVYQEQYEMPIVVPVVEGIAYVPIVSQHFQIFMETRQGTLYTDKKGYTLQRLMFPEAYLGKLRNLAPLSLAFILSDFAGKNRPEQFTLDDVAKIDIFIHSSLVSKAYIREKYPVFTAFLQSHCREELLVKHFDNEVDYTTLDNSMMCYIMELFLQQRQYDKVYDLLQEYCGVTVDGKLLLEMCDERILNTNFQRDDFLLNLCAYLANQQLATPATIIYLAGNTVGPTKEMIHLWKMAKAEELHVLDLEENILFQALYAESQLQEIQPIFESYMTKGKDKMLVEAYMNYWSHEYMLAHEGVPEQLFTYLAYYFDREIPLKESCNLAYMKFLSNLELLSDREYKVLDRLLQFYILRNVYFSFYRNIDERLRIKYHLYDKYFVEYRGNPGERITITYSYDGGEPVEEEMVEIYEGIFVKQFVIFFGETIEYQLYAEQVSDLPVCSDKLVISSQLQEGKGDRYDMINRMQNEWIYNERENLTGDMKQYQGLSQVTKQLFTTI